MLVPLGPLATHTPTGTVHVVGAVRAGFPSPAQDYAHTQVSLDEHLIEDRTSTFVVRVVGDSMEGAGIWDGDEVIVNRALDPRDGDVVVAIIDGELTLKRLSLAGGVARLLAENSHYPPIEISELSEMTIWGVVTFGIRHVR